jgi:hypothetical protein
MAAMSVVRCVTVTKHDTLFLWSFSSIPIFERFMGGLAVIDDIPIPVVVLYDSGTSSTIIYYLIPSLFMSAL